MKRFCFTSKSGNKLSDHYGSIKGARTIAKRWSDIINEFVYVIDPDTNDIVDCIYPDSILKEVSEPVENSTLESDTVSEPAISSESVENKNALTFKDITHIISVLQCRIEEYERAIASIMDSSFSPEAKAYMISLLTKSIEPDKSIVDKLSSLAMEVFKNEIL